MATECPDCSRWFKGNDCSCGYQVKRISRQPESNDMCLAHGCPLVGALSDATRPPHRYFCRHHFGAPADEWNRITKEIRESGEHAKTVQEMHADHLRESKNWKGMPT